MSVSVNPFEGKWLAVSKMDLAAIRACDDLIVRIDQRSHGQVGEVSCVKRAVRSERDPFAVDQRYIVVDCPVMFAERWNGTVTKGATAFAMIGIYRNQVTHAGSVLATLRAGDEVRFEFRADDHSSPMMRERGLHGDVLALMVRRGGKIAADFELQVHVSEPGSSRMVRGVGMRAEAV